MLYCILVFPLKINKKKKLDLCINVLKEYSWLADEKSINQVDLILMDHANKI